MLLTASYNRKGKANDPNNWKCVCLKRLTSKVISSIISTRLLAVLTWNNIEEHFTTIGCQQAMHNLGAALSLMIAHDIDT
jgi:hypothetical protein